MVEKSVKNWFRCDVYSIRSNIFQYYRLPSVASYMCQFTLPRVLHHLLIVFLLLRSVNLRINLAITRKIGYLGFLVANYDTYHFFYFYYYSYV